MNDTPNLKDRCRVVSQKDGDRFVGVKADINDAIVYFPLGYHLPDSDAELRLDILRLFGILGEFMDKKDRLLAMKKFAAPQTVDFPLNAYMEIIWYFMDNGYYKETDPVYKTSDRGKIDWSKTVKKQRALLQKNKDGKFSPIYTLYTVRESTPNDNKVITRIHQHCVYESFSKLGWLFTPYMPPKPEGLLDIKMFLSVLRDKLGDTNNDTEKSLFQSMIEMLKYMDENTSEKQFYFGTDNFEVIWEKLIDKMFGVRDKDEYFPRAKWNLQQGRYKGMHPLQPDTIMLYNDKCYIIDAKYYKYGDTKEPGDLPNASSINKQITYGEYVLRSKQMSESSLYNVFLMPYNKLDNLFGMNNTYGNIGEAIGEWRDNTHQYEHIQGILVDVNFLMSNYTTPSEEHKRILAEFIEKSYIENKNLYAREDH